MRLHGCSEQRNDSCEPASVQVCPAQRWFIAHGVVHRAMPQLVKPWPPHAVPASADGSSRQLSRVRAFCATGPRKLECQGLLAHPPPQFSAVSYWPVTSLGFGICAFSDVFFSLLHFLGIFGTFIFATDGFLSSVRFGRWFFGRQSGFQALAFGFFGLVVC